MAGRWPGRRCPVARAARWRGVPTTVGPMTSHDARVCAATRASVAALFALGAGLRLLAIANSSLTAVGNMPLPDDAFYYFALARNLAAGGSLAISGNDVPTTGFQPLWAAVLAAVERLAGGFSGSERIVAAQLLGASFGLIAGWMIYRLGSRLSASRVPAVVAVGAYLLSPQIVKHNLNGMETSLAIVALLVLLGLFASVNPVRLTPAKALGLGAVTGLGLLARFDLGILAAIGASAWVGSTLRAGKPRELARWAAPFGIGVVLALAPWLWVSRPAGLVPESGQAVRNLTLLLNALPLRGPAEWLAEDPYGFASRHTGFAVEFTSAWVRQMPVLLPATLPVFAAFDLAAAERISAGLGGFVAGALGWLAWRAPAIRRVAVLILTYAVGMTVAYAVFVLGPWFFQRYAAPVAVAVHLLLLCTMWDSLRDPRLRAVAAALAGVGIALGFSALVGWGSYRWIAVGPGAVPDDGFYRAARWVDSEWPEDSRIGAFSAGLLTYYARPPVVALDGKINGEARRAMADGRMFEFLCRARVDGIADWEKMIDRLLVQRSTAWREANLTRLTSIDVDDGNDILILRVERDHCPAESPAIP